MANARGRLEAIATGAGRRISHFARTSSRPSRRLLGKCRKFVQSWVRARRARSRPRLTSPLASQAAVLDCCVAYNEFGGYCVPTSSQHRIAAQTILNGEVYERVTIEAVVAACGDGDVVHAGTYFGDFIPALSGALAPAATLWAFEPNLENYRCAEVTVRINALDNVRLTHGALSARHGTVRLVTTDASGRSLGGLSQVIAESSPRYGYSDEVAAIALDDVIPADRKVSVIQLDVEGHETEVLQGAIETITRCKPMLIVETLPEAGWFDTVLAPLGYRPGPVVGPNRVLTAG